MEDDIIRLRQVLDACPAVPAICLDVANGYSEHFVEFVKTVREKFPDHIIMVCQCRALWVAFKGVLSLIPNLTRCVLSPAEQRSRLLPP